MYRVYRVPVTATEDPPKSGEALKMKFNNFPAACREADRVMYEERNPNVAYFVVPGGYSCGLIG